MKLYTFKFIITLIIIYAIFSVTLFFFYSTVSQGFLENRARDNVQQMNDAIATRLDAQLSFDYGIFQQLIDTYIAQSEDPYIGLQDTIDQIIVGGEFFQFFGLRTDTGIQIGGTNYTFRPTFTSLEYNQPISFYTLTQALTGTHSDSRLFVVFNYNNILGFIDAEAYITPLIASTTEIERTQFIMSSDNMVFYATESLQTDKFFDLLRASNVSEARIEEMKDKLLDNQIFSYKTTMFDETVFATFTPLSSQLSSRSLYFVQTYNHSQSIESFQVLNYTLWAVFGVTLVAFVVSLFLLYHLSASQLNEVESVKMVHYYDKPYLVKVLRNGQIKYFNKVFKTDFKKYNLYKTVNDFDITSRDKIDDFPDFLKKQQAFTIRIDKDGVDRYVHFINVKTRGGFLLAGDDLTDFTGKTDELYSLAMLNPITKLPNKNQLMKDLSEIVKLDNCDGKCSLAMFDVISFSKINLLLNEKLGDQMLVMIKEIAKESLEKYDANLYHISVDQFVILFRNLPQFKWAQEWGSKFIERMNQPIQFEKVLLEIEVKVGIFNVEKDKYVKMTAENIFENVQLALNHAKGSAATQMIIYDIGLSHFASRQEMMAIDLANAILKNEFVMHLQPQYNNLEKKIVGFEALIRWNNPKYSKESPQKFIELAENNNMIIEIGRIALHETFTIAKEFEKYDLHISINVSPVQLLQAGFVNDTIAIFEQYELKRSSISFEITETFLMSSFDLVIQKIKALRDYGFDIHLDDFGTRYSSLQYLRDLPVTTIKIDRAFVKNMHNDRHSRAIVQMISNLAKSVGLKVIAEGVENEKENMALIKAGCNVIQGYWISPPVPKDEAIKLLNKKW